MKKLFRNSVFKFLMSYILILLLTLIMLSFGFQAAFQIVDDNLKVTHVNMLQRSADMIENSLIDIETMALQVANANSILEMAAKRKGDSNYIQTAMDALNDFTLHLNYQDIDLISSDRAYIYFKNTDLVLYERSYYKPEFFKTYLDKWGIDYGQWRAEMEENDITGPIFRKNGDGFEYIFPFSKWLFGEREAYIVFRIDGDAVFEKMKFVNDLENRGLYLVEILDEAGEQLWVSDTTEQFPRVELSELKNGYLERDGMSIIAVRSENLNWYYVLEIPVKESLEKLSTLKNQIILLMVAVVFGGCLLSFIQARKRGKPVDQALQMLSAEDEEQYDYRDLGTAVSEIVSKHKNMLEELENDKPSLQKTFFHDLLKAEFSNETQLQAAAQKAGIKFQDQIYQAVYIQLFAENDFYSVDAQTLSEMHVISKLVMNHLQEVCNQKVWFYKRNYSSITAIFELADIESDAYDLIKQAEEWVRQECLVEISWGIGGTCEDLLLIWRSMEEAKIALENCTRQNPVVRYKAELINSKEYYLPTIAEEKLEECIRAGQWQETKDILALLETENCVNRHLCRHQFIKMNQRILDVLGQVWKKDELKERAFWINEVFMQPELSQQEYFHRLRHLCRKACNDNVVKKQEQRSRLVDEIKEYICCHYCESDMGLTKVGTQFRVSESFLSTIFKEQAGRNFADYLETLRIEKACELLTDRELTVNEVAEMVGYNSVQSFRRAFKRVKGVSPKELRGGEE